MLLVCETAEGAGPVDARAYTWIYDETGVHLREAAEYYRRSTVIVLPRLSVGLLLQPPRAIKRTGPGSLGAGAFPDRLDQVGPDTYH